MTMAISVLRDSEGYLANPEDWDETMAGELAREEQLALDQDYWPVLRFIRDYWQENRIAPDVRHVLAWLAAEQGVDKKAAKKELFRLFPYGYVKQACKIAGMQRPRVWSTG